MSVGKWIGIGMVSTAMVAGGGIWVRAQSPRVLPSPRVAPLPVPGQEPATIISGSDVGFRVDSWEGDVPVGRWVVRSEGKWVEPRTMGGIRRLTAN